MLQEISRKKDQVVTFSLPIAKVDKATRTVKGIASQEVVDAHGQIVDYATLKACLPAYKNNIREMHQPKAVGKAVAIECDDTNQAVIVEAYVSKGAEDTWTKVEEGILTSYSIGGVGDVVVGKNADGKTEQRIFLSALHEISLVDVPACPTATFEIVKMVDGAPTDVRPADPEPPAAEAVADTTAVSKAAQIRKRLWEGYDIERALAVLALLQGIISSEIDDLVWGDPAAEGDAEAAAQLDTLRLAAQLVFDFVASEFDSQFTALEARQAAVGKLAGPIGEAITKALGEPGVKKALKAIDKALAQKMHDNSVHLGAACKESTMKTATETPAAGAESTQVEKAGEAEALTAIAAEQARVDAEKAAAIAPDVQAFIKTAAEEAAKAATEQAAATFEKQLEEQKATSDATIAKLEERLKKVEDSPAPGGPVKQAVPGTPVDKALAGGPAVTTTPDDVTKAVQALVEAAPDMTPEQRKSASHAVLVAALSAPTSIAR